MSRIPQNADRELLALTADNGSEDPILPVESLVVEFQSMVAQLRSSAINREQELHANQAIDACRLSRRIRLRLGNPYELSEGTKQKIIMLFGDCARNIDLSLPFDDEALDYITKCKENINSRAYFIEHPEKLEEELLSAGT